MAQGQISSIRSSDSSLGISRVYLGIYVPPFRPILHENLERERERESERERERVREKKKEKEESKLNLDHNL